MAQESKAAEETLAIIKPNAFEQREKVVELMKSEGFTVVERYDLTLTQMRAEAFYAEHKGRGFFDELIQFMISGPVTVLKLAKEGGIKEWRRVMGPTNVEVAKKEAPNSVRALYGEDMTKNAAHGSDSPDSAARELHFFFGVEDTFAMIKPNAMPQKEAILAEIKANQFEVVKQSEFQLSKEQAETFYEEHKGKGFFDELVNFMISAPIVALQLRRANAIKGWRNLMGPTNFKTAQAEAPLSLRARYASGMTENATHGSDAPETAAREIGLMFGEKGFAV